MTTSKMNKLHILFTLAFRVIIFILTIFVAMNHRQNLCHFKPTE